MRQTNLLSVICVEKPEQLKQNNDTKAYKQKTKESKCQYSLYVRMENGGTIKHDLLSENHIKCKTGKKNCNKGKI